MPVIVEADLNFWFFASQDQEGATLLVSAKFSIVSAPNIYLQFEESVSLSFFSFSFLIYLQNDSI